MEKKLYYIACAVLVILVLVIMSLVYVNKDQLFGNKKNEYACTMEAKICPDGSAVGRQGAQCEFAACPAFPTGSAIIQRSSAKNMSEEIKQPTIYVAFTEKEYTTLKERLGVQGDITSYPALDFTKEYVVAFALGMRSSSGYTVSLKSVTEDDTAITYTFIESQPGERCMTLTVIDYPYVIVRRDLPSDTKMTKKQLFQVEKVTRPTCD
jgi:hypothetical protein